METKKICVRADKENMQVLDALELINQNQRDGLARRKSWLEEIEYRAAIAQKENQKCERL